MPPLHQRTKYHFTNEFADLDEFDWENSPKTIRQEAFWGTKVGVLAMSLFLAIFPNASALAAYKRHQEIVITATQIMNEKFKPNEKHANLAIKALKIIPQAHYKSLKRLKIKDIDSQDPRGLANKQTLILNRDNIDTEEEFIAVFLHEIGHVTDLGMLKARRHSKSQFRKVDRDDPSIKFYKTAWKNENTRKPFTTPFDFISGYAMSNIFEDFAESYLFYILHGDQFRYLSKKNTTLNKKYKFIKKTVFQNKEFDFAKQNPEYDRLTFDTTLVDYDLKKLLAHSEEEDEEDRKDIITKAGKARPTRRGRTRVRNFRGRVKQV